MLFLPYARLFAQDPSLKGADLRLLFYILSLIGKDNGFLLDRVLNNRVACKYSAGDYSNEHTPLLLSDDCSYSELPILIHSSKYVVRKLTVDGKEFDAVGANEEFE